MEITYIKPVASLQGYAVASFGTDMVAWLGNVSSIT